MLVEIDKLHFFMYKLGKKFTGNAVRENGKNAIIVTFLLLVQFGHDR